MPTEIRQVDPRESRLPPSRLAADPVKLARQINRFGASFTGMPPLIVYEGADGELVIYDGVTRATRVSRLAPGALITVEIAGRLKRPAASLPKIGDVP